VNLDTAAPAASGSGLFGRGLGDDVESDVQAKIAADLARLEREVQLELQGGGESRENGGGDVGRSQGGGTEVESGREEADSQEKGAQTIETASVADGIVQGRPAESSEAEASDGVRASDPLGVSGRDDDRKSKESDDRKDAEKKEGETPETTPLSGAADGDASDRDDDIKEIGEELFPGFDGSTTGQMASSSGEETSSSAHRGPDDIRTVGEELFPDFEPSADEIRDFEPSADEISRMGKALGQEIRQVAGYVGSTETGNLRGTMPDGRDLNQFLQVGVRRICGKPDLATSQFECSSLLQHHHLNGSRIRSKWKTGSRAIHKP
jgi:hypothetical protein